MMKGIRKKVLLIILVVIDLFILFTIFVDKYMQEDTADSSIAEMCEDYNSPYIKYNDKVYDCSIYNSDFEASNLGDNIINVDDTSELVTEGDEKLTTEVESIDGNEELDKEEVIKSNSEGIENKTSDSETSETYDPVQYYSEDSVVINVGGSFDLNRYLNSFADSVGISDVSDISTTGYVNTREEGQYNMSFSVTSHNNDLYVYNLKVVVVDNSIDTESPVIVLSTGGVVISKGDSFNPYDYVIDGVDNVDGDITSQITATKNFNTNVSGVYFITYSLSDSSGNDTSKTLILTVK